MDKEQSVINKTIDYIFSMKRELAYLLIIFILGFILRAIAAINLTVSADDMHHVTHTINFYSAGRLVVYDQSAGLWHAFTSIIYKLLGMTQLSSRFAALLFGSLSILVIYLLAKEFFNEKIALISAFLLAIAPFHILNTLAEMDVMAMFFVLIGMLIFIRALKKDKFAYFAISGIFMGAAVYTKVYPLLFIPSLLLYFIYYNKKEKRKIITKDNIKKIIIFLFAAFIFTLPALAHNYLLYKDKGFLDLQFTRTLGLGKNISAQYYSWDHQFDAKNDWAGLIFGNSTNSASKIPTLWAMADYFRIADPIAFYLGIIGLLIILLYKKEHKSYLVFFFLSILFVFPFLASIILLPKHYLFVEILLIPIGAIALNSINKKLSNISKKNISKIVVCIILIISLILLGQPSIPNIFAPNTYHFYGTSHVEQIIDFKNENIPQNALIIGDSRIYRGQINWAFQGRPYLEGIDFINILNNKELLQGNDVAIDIYFFECIPDDCGWGTIKNQPELNQTMEELVKLFRENGKLVKTIDSPIERKPYYPIFSENKEDIINIYSMKIPLKESVLLLANQPKDWFLYTIGYEPKEKQFDYYTAHGFLDKSLDRIAHWMVTISLILAFLSPIYVIYLIIKK